MATRKFDWEAQPLLAFDTETTGIDVTKDRIITASLVEFQPGHRPVAKTWVIDPGVEVPAEAAKVHGWTNQRLAEDPRVRRDVGEALGEFTERLLSWLQEGSPIVAYNAAYDLTLLHHEGVRHGFFTDSDPLGFDSIGSVSPVLDPHVIDKGIDKYRKGSRTLTATCEHYGIPLVAAHSSESDAASSARLMRAIGAKLGPRHRRLQDLHDAQITWRAEQMNSLRAYFDQAGKPHDGCNPGWPLHDPNFTANTKGAA